MATSSDADTTTPPDCPLCLQPLADVVKFPCGHTYCNGCTSCLLAEHEHTGSYSCKQCGQAFTSKPIPNGTLDEVGDRLRRTDLRDDPQAAPGDVTCDICTDKNLKAVKSCLVCIASYCKAHLGLHDDLHAGAGHTLVDATGGQLQGRTCSQHDKVLEVYCRTDQRCICCLCMLDEHKGHDVTSLAAGRTEREEELKSSKQTITARETQLKMLRTAKSSLRKIALATEEESERLINELISLIKSGRTDIKVLIRAREKAELDRVEDCLNSLEQEIAELKSCHAELEQLSHTQDDLLFLQSAQSLGLSPGPTDAANVVFNPQFSCGEVVKSLSVLKGQIEDIWKQEHSRISSAVKKDKILVPLEPKTREDLLQYFVPLSLDPNTAHRSLRLSSENRAVVCDPNPQPYPDHPDRFDWWAQVLCQEALSGRCYWEVEWTGLYGVDIAVSYRDICRKGEGDECGFGYNKHCWSLDCSISKYIFIHNNEETEMPVPMSHRIGVYLDHRGGILSFYSVSDSMTLLHKVETRFTHPLYAGFGLYQGSTAKICQVDQEAKAQKMTKKVQIQTQTTEKMRKAPKYKILRRK